jgi:hypothetical protein
VSLGLIEFLVVSVLVLGLALVELVPLYRYKRRAERARRGRADPPR